MDIANLDKNIVRIAVLSATAGFALGYFLGKRRNEDEFDEAVDAACAENREYYRRKRIELEEMAAEADQVVTEAASALATYQGVEPLVDEEVDQAESMDYDTTEDEGFGPESVDVVLPTEPEPKHKKAAYVDKSKPYVVSVDEVLNNEGNYQSSTLTYYEGDDTLSGEGDNILDDRDRLLTVGTNLSNFGELSDDPRVVYVRNDKLMMYLEVVKHDGKYSEVVAGLGGNE